MRFYVPIFYLLLVLVASCTKPKSEFEPTPVPMYGSPNPTIIWKQILSSDSSYSSSIDPFLFEDLIITSSESPSDGNEVLQAYNKNNGELIWTWDEYIRPAPQRIRGPETLLKIENTLIASSSQDKYAIDLTSGNSIWSTNMESGDISISNFEANVFQTFSYGISPHSDSSKIVMCDYLTGDWQDVFTVYNDDNFNPYFHPPAGYTNQNGERLLIFQNRGGVINTGFVDRVDLYCYNVDQDSIVWYKPDFTPSGSSNVRKPIVEGDRVYFGGKWDFYCIDIPSGEIIWTHNFYHDYQGSNYVFHNDLIIIDLDNGDLIASNKNTGNQVWVNESLAGCCTELRIFGDRVYYGTSNMHIVNVNTGKELYEFSSPHPGASFLSAIAVDLENNKMYTTDGYYLLCMELPE